jgi:hypothetical protein
VASSSSERVKIHVSFSDQSSNWILLSTVTTRDPAVMSAPSLSMDHVATLIEALDWACTTPGEDSLSSHMGSDDKKAESADMGLSKGAKSTLAGRARGLAALVQCVSRLLDPGGASGGASGTAASAPVASSSVSVSVSASASRVREDRRFFEHLVASAASTASSSHAYNDRPSGTNGLSCPVWRCAVLWVAESILARSVGERIQGHVGRIVCGPPIGFGVSELLDSAPDPSGSRHLHPG